MEKVNWKEIKYFKAQHFSENPNDADPLIFYNLDFCRKRMNQRIFPSPVKGALARFSGSTKSQHYAVNRQSTACDVFCEGIPIINFLSILHSKLFNGIGIYLDTKGIDGLPWIMFHLDIRKRAKNKLPLIWIAEKLNIKDKLVTKYRYPQSESKYWSLLRDTRLYTAKYKNGTTPAIT